MSEHEFTTHTHYTSPGDQWIALYAEFAGRVQGLVTLSRIGYYPGVALREQLEATLTALDRAKATI